VSSPAVKPCPHCGSSVAAEVQFCSQCGKTIELGNQEITRRVPITIDEATADPPRVESKATVVGNAGEFSKTITDTSSVEQMLASLEWTPPPSEPKLEAAPAPTPAPVPAAPSEPRGPTFGKTMIGGSITAAEVQAEHERTKAAAAAAGRPPMAHGTMIGTPMLDKPAFDFDPAPVAPEPSSQPPADPQAFRPAFKTMLGVAVPGIAPIRDSERAMMAASAAPAPPPPGTNPHFPVYPNASHMPVPPASSRPYTAPLAVPLVPPSQPRIHAPPPPIVPPPAPLVEEPLPQAPRAVASAKGGISAIAVVAIVFVLVLIGGGAAAVVFLRAGAPLTAKARLDETGKESLDIHCESCPDGTKIALGASSAQVASAAAILTLPAPLSIGDNDLEIAIDRPGAGRDEKVKVHVPIAYRVKADLTTLSALPPTVTVRVEATPGADVTVDGKPVTLDANGKGSYALDVSAEAFGPSDDQKAIDRKISFSVKRKGTANPDPGELVVRAAIVPLHLDAPGSELTTERATANVAGQTKPGGVLSVDGQNVAVDVNGRFAIRAELPAEGDKTLTIVASAPPLAPRTIHAKITRVASLDAAAQKLDAANPLGFDAYSVEPAQKVDQLVSINGEILEIRVTQGYTLMVVEEKKTCAAGGGCVLRLVHGEEVRAVRGDTLRAYGKVSGTVPWNGKTVPAIVGTLAIVVPAPKGKR